MTTPPSSDWVPLAVFAQPHGVSGRIKVKSLSDEPDSLVDTDSLTDESGKPVKLKVTGKAQGMMIVEVEGITKREQAELLRGKKIGVLRTALPELDNPNRYYIRDLVGLTVLNLEGTAVGTVSDVVNYGAGDILVIMDTNRLTELYAFTHATFPEVDLPNKRIVINPPEIVIADKPATHA